MKCRQLNLGIVHPNIFFGCWPKLQPTTYHFRASQCLTWKQYLMFKSGNEPSYPDYDCFLVHRYEFVVNIGRRGLDFRLRHCIGLFTEVTDRILYPKCISTGCIVSEDIARTRFLDRCFRGLFDQKSELPSKIKKNPRRPDQCFLDK